MAPGAVHAGPVRGGGREMAATERSPRAAHLAISTATGEAVALRQTLAALGLAEWELDLESDTAHWSEAFARLHGLAGGVREGTREGLLALVHADDRARVAQALAGAIGAGERFTLDYRLNVSGDARWIASRGRIERDAAGCPLRLYGLAEDVTAAKRQAMALERREQRYRELFEQASDILYTLDLQGNFTEVNREHERVVGYTADELIGRPVRNLVL